MGDGSVETGELTVNLKVIIDDMPGINERTSRVTLVDGAHRRVIAEYCTPREAADIARAASIGMRAAFAAVARAAIAAREQE